MKKLLTLLYALFGVPAILFHEACHFFMTVLLWPLGARIYRVRLDVDIHFVEDVVSETTGLVQTYVEKDGIPIKVTVATWRTRLIGFLTSVAPLLGALLLLYLSQSLWVSLYVIFYNGHFVPSGNDLMLTKWAINPNPDRKSLSYTNSGFIKNIPYPIRIVLSIIGGMMLVALSIPLNWGPFYLVNSLWPALPASLLIVYWVARWEGILDAKKIKKEQPINHFTSAVFRVLFVVGVCMGLNAYFWHWSAIATLVLFSLCWYGLVFNYYINTERGLHAFYISKKDHKKGSIIDKLFNDFKEGGEILALLELLVLLLSGYVYINQV